MLHVMQQIHHLNAEDTKYATQDSKYANQNSKYAQYRFTLFYRNAIFVTNLGTFLAYNSEANKCGGVQKITNMRYAPTPHFAFCKLELALAIC